MGYDISEVDMLNVQTFADRVINLEEYRQRLRESNARSGVARYELQQRIEREFRAEADL